jgi:hypothetical protein
VGKKLIIISNNNYMDNHIISCDITPVADKTMYINGFAQDASPANKNITYVSNTLSYNNTSPLSQVIRHIVKQEITNQRLSERMNILSEHMDRLDARIERLERFYMIDPYNHA